jgi:hypothetical protein
MLPVLDAVSPFPSSLQQVGIFWKLEGDVALQDTFIYFLFLRSPLHGIIYTISIFSWTHWKLETDRSLQLLILRQLVARLL